MDIGDVAVLWGNLEIAGRLDRAPKIAGDTTGRQGRWRVAAGAMAMRPHPRRRGTVHRHLETGFVIADFGRPLCHAYAMAEGH